MKRAGTLKKVDTFLLLVIAAVIAYWVISPSFHETEKAADIEVVLFDDKISYETSENGTVNVEIWIENLGNAVARNITCHMRARNQNGTILFEGNISMTSSILRPNETCTGYCSFDLMKNDTCVYYTVEVMWNTGRTIFSKKTSIL